MSGLSVGNIVYIRYESWKPQQVHDQRWRILLIQNVNNCAVRDMDAAQLFAFSASVSCVCSVATDYRELQ